MLTASLRINHCPSYRPLIIIYIKGRSGGGTGLDERGMLGKLDESILWLFNITLRSLPTGPRYQKTLIKKKIIATSNFFWILTA